MALAASLQVGDPAVQRGRRLAIAELFVALDRASPRRFRVLETAQAPQGTGPVRKRFGPLACPLRGQQLQRGVDEPERLLEGPDRQRIARGAAQVTGGARRVRCRAGL